MHVRSLVIINVFVLCTLRTQAQKLINPESDTIKWSYGRIDNKIRSEALSISGHFISYGGKAFIWSQNGSNHDYFFDVRGAKGSWSDVENSGELVYDAICEGIDGTIRIYGRGRNVVIQLDFRKPDKLTPNIDLRINSYSKL